MERPSIWIVRWRVGCSMGRSLSGAGDSASTGNDARIKQASKTGSGTRAFDLSELLGKKFEACIVSLGDRDSGGRGRDAGLVSIPSGVVGRLHIVRTTRNWAWPLIMRA